MDDIVSATANAGTKLKVFISYSRSDQTFVDRLGEALQLHDIEALVDRSHIEKFADWWERIQQLIGAADTVVFALSPDALKSGTCQREVAYASQLNKRFAPIVVRDVYNVEVPEELKRLNYIFFRDGDDFGAALDDLVAGLRSDIVWVREHTRLGELARRWLAEGRPLDQLLRGAEIDSAETWAARRPPYAPATTESHLAWIGASRAEATAGQRRARIRSRFITAGSLTAALATSTLGWFFYDALRESQRRQSFFLADLARQHIETHDEVSAMLLALEGLPDAHGSSITERLRPYVPQAEIQLDAGTRNQHEHVVLAGHSDAVNTATYSPDGTMIVTASADSTARLWDAGTGKELQRLASQTKDVKTAAFSPDGTRVVAASVDKTARIYDTATGAMMARLSGHGNEVSRALFSPDGSRVLTASLDSTARLWDGHNGDPIAALTGHKGGVWDAEFSPDGSRIVTASGDHTARVWDASIGKALVTLEGHSDTIWHATFSADGERIVTASNDKTARIWDATTGAPIAELKGHAENVWRAEFSRDGKRVVTTSSDKTVRVWDAKSGASIATMSGHSDDIRFATFSADGRRIISASHDGTARLWDARTGEEVFVLPKQGPLWSAALSPDGESLVTASSDGTARIWNSKNSFAPVVFGGHTDTVLRVALSPDETRVVTASEDKTAKVFDARTGAPKLTLVGHQGQVSSATFSPDATQIATASWDNTARLWDAKTGALRLTLSGHESFVTDVAFSPDGKRLATASYDNSFRIWDANSGSPLATCRGDKGHLRGITFSPDGTRIVSSPDDRMAQIWDAKTCDLVLTLKVPMAGISTGVYSAAFSSDGRRIVTASNDRTARIWDAFSGAPLGEPLYHPLDMDGGGVGVSGAAFSPDGRRVLTTTKHSLRLWDLETRTVVAEVPGTGSNSSAGAVLDGQGMHVLSPSYGKTARLWRIFPNTQALVEQAKSSVPRCLTPDERKKYFLDPDPPIWCIEMQKWPYQDTPLPPPWHIRVFERAKTWLFPAKKNDLRWIDPTRSF